MMNIDNSALFNLEYGVYVVTTDDGTKDNGCIVNTVCQVSNVPARISVSINKNNYTHDIVKATKKMNLNCLTVDTPFSVFERFGFSSGRDTDKFDKGFDVKIPRAENGIAYLDKYINSYISLEVEQYVDLDSHGLFICKITEAKKVNDNESMSYLYYHAKVKPQPVMVNDSKGWRCVVCNYVYEGEVLPEDFVCPLCKHPACDFVQM